MKASGLGESCLSWQWKLIGIQSFSSGFRKEELNVLCEALLYIQELVKPRG